MSKARQLADLLDSSGDVVTDALDNIPAPETSAPPTQQVFTSSGTWTKPDGCKTVKVTVVGGGSAGGNSSSAYASAPGGSSGGASIKVIDVTAISSETVTVGAGGTGGGGAAGGTSSFGAHCSATGGSGSTTYGSGSGGDINIDGTGDTRMSNSSGYGGDSYIGPSVHQRQGAGNGFDAVNAGAGGGGGGFTSDSTLYYGGNGADGIVIVEEFY